MRKNEKTALRYSIITTAVPVIAGGVVFFGFSYKFDNWDDAESIIAASLGGAGVIFGPGVGHAYAGNSKRMVTGALLRTLPLAGIVAGIAWKKSMEGEESVGPGIVLPLGAAVGLAIYDIATVGRSVEQYNRKHRLTHVDFAPCLLVQCQAVGFSITVSW